MNKKPPLLLLLFSLPFLFLKFPYAATVFWVLLAAAVVWLFFVAGLNAVHTATGAKPSALVLFIFAAGCFIAAALYGSQASGLEGLGVFPIAGLGITLLVASALAHRKR